jgi:hypothetical protein
MVTTLYISLKTEPEQIYINSNKSSLKNKYCVASQITNLLVDFFRKSRYDGTQILSQG